MLPILFYLVLGVTSGYLVWGRMAIGLNAKLKFDAEAAELTATALRAEGRAHAMERRVANLMPKASTGISSMRRPMLDRVAKDEVVIFTDTGKVRYLP